MSIRPACFSALFCAIVGVTAAFGWIPPDCDRHSIWYIQPDEYAALIEHHDGAEILTVPTILPDKPGAGWLIRIPAPPADVKLAWLKQMPTFRGRTPDSILHAKLDMMLPISRATQVYPIIFDAIFAPSYSYSAVIERIEGNDVETSEMACQKLTIKSSDELITAVASAGVDLPPEAVSKMAANHLDQTFLLITGRLTVASGLRGHEPVIALTDLDMPCLEVRFPSEKAVLPARLPADSESNRRTWVCLKGHYQPLGVFPAYTEIQAFYGSKFRDRTITPLGDTTYGSIETNVPYTRVIGADASEEMPFVPGYSFSVSLTDHFLGFIANPITYALSIVTLILFFSYVSGGLAGWLTAGHWHGYARLGCWNLLTIFGLMLRTHALAANGRLSFPKTPKAYLFTFTVSFVILTIFGHVILNLFMGDYSPMWGVSP